MSMFIQSCKLLLGHVQFMDPTFQIPMQYRSLQHQNLLSPPDTSTAEHFVCVSPASSFLLHHLAIAFSSSPAAHRPPSDLGGSSSAVMWFLPFHTFQGVLTARILEWVAISLSSGPLFSGSQPSCGKGACITQWSYDPLKLDRSQWRVLTKCDPPEEALYYRWSFVNSVMQKESFNSTYNIV